MNYRAIKKVSVNYYIVFTLGLEGLSVLGNFFFFSFLQPLALNPSLIEMFFLMFLFGLYYKKLNIKLFNSDYWDWFISVMCASLP